MPAITNRAAAHSLKSKAQAALPLTNSGLK
jgi:hypothetical protein